MGIAAHIYDNEENASQAISILNEALGYPVTEDAETKGYTTYYTYGNGWYIMADDNTIALIGAPIEIPDIELNF